MTFEEFKQAFPVIVPVNVAWGEMDAFQHLNNVIYLRYFETARIAYMQKIGLNINVADAKNNENPIGPILADSYCRYRRPVTFPDTLYIGCRISELQEFGFMMEYQAFSEQQQTIATIGNSRIVMLNYFTGQKEQLPEKLLYAINQLQSL
ncbi:thioesterase family protein [Kangiella sp. HZ709]|uniref:acyl-CoA thioesterase n=1 Tax=Kangiella sp. HZ709 TaxID=2666328 RepID=UPI0012AEF8F0|nr:acyl-CoA thioesterase [Kangiella sp. HZ709]MRX27391.1 acyl-CoA thioesterase [Kangiella sp. HZ709]